MEIERSLNHSTGRIELYSYEWDMRTKARKVNWCLIGVVDLQKMRLDNTGCHALRIQRDHVAGYWSPTRPLRFLSTSEKSTWWTG
jgi:hypothetical protein